MNDKKIIECFKKMGYDAKKSGVDKINVEIPAWRADILHDIDLVEDVAVGYGFDRFETDFPKYLTLGKILSKHVLYDSLRNILIGLGFNEVTTFIISNEKDEFNKLGLKPLKRVEIKNPIGEDYTCLRTTILPSLMKILNENRHHPLPQQIFEVGIRVGDDFKNNYNVAAVKIDAKANFTECKSYVEAVLRDIGVKYNIRDKNHPGFVKGRCASVIYKNKEIGFFGELHPKTIKEFDLEHPIIGFELETDSLPFQ
jgi:phenylalanyl-tRNA synthetase beta chain